MAHASPFTNTSSLSPAPDSSAIHASPMPPRSAANWTDSSTAIDAATRSLDTIKAILSTPQTAQTTHDLSRNVSDTSMLPPSTESFHTQLPVLSQPNVLSYGGAPVNVAGLDRFSSQNQYPYFASASMFQNPSEAERYQHQLQYMMMAGGYPQMRPQMPTQLPYPIDQGASYDSSGYPAQFKPPMHPFSMMSPMASRQGQDVLNDVYGISRAAAGYPSLPHQFNHQAYFDQAAASHQFNQSAASSLSDARAALQSFAHSSTLPADSHCGAGYSSGSADMVPSPTISTNTTSTEKSSSPLHPYFAHQSILASFGLSQSHPLADAIYRLTQPGASNPTAQQPAASYGFDHEGSPFYNAYGVVPNRNRSCSDSSATSIASATLGQESSSAVSSSHHPAPSGAQPNAKRQKGKNGQVKAESVDPTHSPHSHSSDDSTSERKQEKPAKKGGKTGAVKLPRTAYVIFASAERKRRRDDMLRLLESRKAAGLKSSKEYMRSLFGQLTRDVAAAWKLLPEDQKQPYRQKAQQDKSRFQREKKEFLASEAAGAFDERRSGKK